MFFIAVAQVLSLLWQLKDSIDIQCIMGKVKIGLYCYISHCRYFDKSLTEMFFELSFTKHIIFSKPLNFICFNGNREAKGLRALRGKNGPLGNGLSLHML